MLLVQSAPSRASSLYQIAIPEHWIQVVDQFDSAWITFACDETLLPEDVDIELKATRYTTHRFFEEMPPTVSAQLRYHDKENVHYLEADLSTVAWQNHFPEGCSRIHVENVTILWRDPITDHVVRLMGLDPADVREVRTRNESDGLQKDLIQPTVHRRVFEDGEEGIQFDVVELYVPPEEEAVAAFIENHPGLELE